MKRFTFYAVISRGDGGLVSVAHDKYTEVKAIFPSKELAENCIAKQTEPDGFQIRSVEILSK